MKTADRDTRIKTHYAAARHPELVRHLLASDLHVDTCMRELGMVGLTPPGSRITATTSPATTTRPTATSPVITEAETVAAGILAAYHSNVNPSTQAAIVAAGILDSYRVSKIHS